MVRYDTDLWSRRTQPGDTGDTGEVGGLWLGAGQRRPVTATVKGHASTVVFAVAFVVLGLPDFGQGVAWPDMRSDFDRPLADLGTFLAVAAGGYLVIATSTGRLAKRWGVDGLVLRSTLSSAAGLLTVAISPAWFILLVGSLLCGAGAGGMDTGFNTAVALRADGRLMGLLHAGYGLGAAIGPVVVGASLATGGGWRPGYAGSRQRASSWPSPFSARAWEKRRGRRQWARPEGPSPPRDC